MADKFRRKREPHHLRLYHSIMDSAAYHSLSGNAVKVLLALVRVDNGTRNGQIAYSYRRAAEDTGLSGRTCLRCLDELQEKGFIVCTQKGSFSRKVLHASLWRYTWQAWPEGKIGPTRDFEKWKPDGNTRVQVLQSSGAVSNNQLETQGRTGADIAAEETPKPQNSVVSTLDRIAPLTSNQGEPSGTAEIKQRKQANPISGANLTFLRSCLIDHLKVSEPGEQSRLASMIDCPGGTLSKFKNGANLPPEYIESLADTLNLGSEAA